MIGPGVTVPDPFEVMVTEFALLNVLPEIEIGAVEQVLPLRLARVTAGGFVQPHDTVILGLMLEHPLLFFTVTVWLPLITDENTGLLW